MPSKRSVIDKKNILITGGAGFIGSHLCDALVRDHHVICMDNFSTSTVANIEHLLQNSNFEFINHDITQPFDLASYSELERFKIKFQGIQEIYHLATPISKRHFEDFKIATVLTNSIGTKNVLDVAVANHSKVLYASSSVLYGPRRTDRPHVSETDPCTLDHLTPRGAYDEGKRFSESILETYADVYGLDVKISRIFRVYGPRMKIFDGNLLPDMINNAIDGTDIELTSPEDAKISLAYVSDVVDGLVRHMNTPVDVTVVNLGSDQEHFLSSVASMITKLCDSASRIRFEPSASGWTEAGLPDISKARQVLGWLPLVRLEDGLRQMIDYSRSKRRESGTFSE
ncbi:NAD-dependent epimerase/dehydratase family protein [Candidatus Uhrbacteria bacterium]|nr:NAD-dependent epimerase/dehydratase family protein [Candidatus Uhrbacteria bacterium]